MSFWPKDQFEPKAFKHPAGSEAVAAAYLVRALRGPGRGGLSSSAGQGLPPPPHAWGTEAAGESPSPGRGQSSTREAGPGRAAAERRHSLPRGESGAAGGGRRAARGQLPSQRFPPRRRGRRGRGRRHARAVASVTRRNANDPGARTSLGRWFDSGSKEVPDAFAPSGKPRPRSARPASAPRRPWQPGVAVFPQAQVGETFRAQPPTQPRVRCRQGHTPAPSSRSLPTRASPRPFHSFPFPPQTDSSGRRACALGQPPRRPGVWAFVKTVPLHLGLGLGLLPHLPGRGGPCFRPSQLLQALSPSSLPLVWSRKIQTYGDRRPPDLLGGTGLAHLRVLVPKPLPTARSRRGGRWPKRDAAGAPTGLAVVMSKNLGGAFGSLVDGRTLEASRAVAPVPAAAGGQRSRRGSRDGSHAAPHPHLRSQPGRRFSCCTCACGPGRHLLVLSPTQSQSQSHCSPRRTEGDPLRVQEALPRKSNR
ncbi:translation initiation factor IF-2-like [Canis lupus dingo]|uniref:translation initiation factor IF-2-like n=1 Tax=Canis lupus dingo TaxID=286419 RepID=UPI0020C497C4|nr:translation initiation factor IF-2-like [Canis lupus dingo]